MARIMSSQIFYKIVDILPVELSVNFLDQSDNNICAAILGANNICTCNIDNNTWAELMCDIANFLYKLYNNHKTAFYAIKYNFLYTD